MATYKVKRNFGLVRNQNMDYVFEWMIGRYLFIVPCNRKIAQFILWINA